MNVMVVGQGGREHALVWKLAQSPAVENVFCAPGNPGMRQAERVDCAAPAALAEFAARNEVALTVVGPEAPLCAGVVDVFRECGLRIFGPDRNAARLEGSKDYAKRFMARHGIPTATARSFDNPDDACAALADFGAPVVVKADGLAAGKGVTVAATREQAEAAIRECMSGVFGEAGQRVLLEECLVGEEASILALVDGATILPLASSQDHKRACDGDSGPNTGGMGAYSPAPVVDDALWTRVRTEVLDRFLEGCRRDGLDYRGVIYAGVMVTQDGPKVLEFNVRFGDPETQAVLPRLKSDLAEAMVATADARLADIDLQWSAESAVCVVMASGGYPGTYQKGHVIEGLPEAESGGAIVFHAGTDTDDRGRTVTAGGRVLGVTALGPTVADAARDAYRGVHRISWPGVQYRTDIAHRAIHREPAP